LSSEAPVEDLSMQGGVRESYSEMLDEGIRLVWRARSGLQSQYHDRLLLAGTAGILVTLVSMLAMFFVDGLRILDTLGGEVTVAFAVLGGMLTMVSIVILFRRDSMRKIRACDSWAGRFAATMSGSEGPEGSSLSLEGSAELLVSATREVPAWLRAGDHDIYYREPGLWLPPVIFALISSNMIANGLAGPEPVDLTRMTWSAVGVFLLGLTILVCVWWDVLRRRANKRNMADWASRAESLRGRMETYLQGL